MHTFPGKQPRTAGKQPGKPRPVIAKKPKPSRPTYGGKQPRRTAETVLNILEDKRLHKPVMKEVWRRIGFKGKLPLCQMTDGNSFAAMQILSYLVNLLQTYNKPRCTTNMRYTTNSNGDRVPIITTWSPHIQAIVDWLREQASDGESDDDDISSDEDTSDDDISSDSSDDEEGSSNGNADRSTEAVPTMDQLVAESVQK